MSRKSHLLKRKAPANNRSQPVLKEQVVQVVRQELRHHSGPLPDSLEMERYEQICPGYAMELLEMAKKSQSHQHEIDKEEQRIHASYLERHHKLFGRGQIIAGILGVTALVGGTIIAATKSPEFGSGIIGATMAAIAGSFIWSNWNKGKKEE